MKRTRRKRTRRALDVEALAPLIAEIVRHEYRNDRRPAGERRPWPRGYFWAVWLANSVSTAYTARRHGGKRPTPAVRYHIETLKRERDTDQFDALDREAIDTLAMGWIRGPLWHWQVGWLADHLAEALAHPSLGRRASFDRSNRPAVRVIRSLLWLLGEQRSSSAIVFALRHHPHRKYFQKLCG